MKFFSRHDEIYQEQHLEIGHWKLVIGNSAEGSRLGLKTKNPAEGVLTAGFLCKGVYVSTFGSY
jgi:hypothetical protein